MTRKEVLYKVLEIINEHKSADSPEATENSRLAEDLGMDSLDLVESAMHIERRLDIHFDGDDYEKIKFGIASVKDFVDLACKKLNIPTNGVQKNVEKTVIKPVQPQNPELKKLEQVDFAKLPKSPIELNGYEIVVKKLAETKQIKR